MSFRCNIFGHKWKYYKEDVTYIIWRSKIKSIASTNPKGFENKWPTDVRLCSKCYCKQIKNIDLHVSNLNFHWSDWKLTKEELRDKNLKKLGV
jgi:hypothetical protein